MQTSYNFLSGEPIDTKPASTKYKKTEHLQTTFTKVQTNDIRKMPHKPLMLCESHELFDVEKVCSIL